MDEGLIFTYARRQSGGAAVRPGDLSGVLGLVVTRVVHGLVVDGVEGLADRTGVRDVGPVNLEVVPGSVVHTGARAIVRCLVTGHGWRRRKI